MIKTRICAASFALLLMLTGCSADTKGNTHMAKELTWQEAKAESLAMQLEIADLIPADKIVEVKQRKNGSLFSCSETQHNWKGATTVTLAKGTEVEPLVKEIEAHYQDSRFTVETDHDIVGDYRVQLRSPDTAENYIIVKDDTDKLRIASGSACFTLPDDVYPGGDF